MIIKMIIMVIKIIAMKMIFMMMFRLNIIMIIITEQLSSKCGLQGNMEDDKLSLLEIPHESTLKIKPW